MGKEGERGWVGRKNAREGSMAEERQGDRTERERERIQRVRE